jgi:hypothetical protein
VCWICSVNQGWEVGLDISHSRNQTVHVVLTAQAVVPASHQGLQVLAALNVLLFAAAVRLDEGAAHCQRILMECKLSKGMLVNKSLKQDRECRLGGKGLGPAAVEVYTRLKIYFSLTKFTKHKRKEE